MNLGTLWQLQRHVKQPRMPGQAGGISNLQGNAPEEALATLCSIQWQLLLPTRLGSQQWDTDSTNDLALGSPRIAPLLSAETLTPQGSDYLLVTFNKNKRKQTKKQKKKHTQKMKTKHDRADRLAGKATITSGFRLGRWVLRRLRHYLRSQSRKHTIDRRKDRGVERGSARQYSLKGRERVIVNQTNIGNVSKATKLWGNLWETGWSVYGLFRAHRSWTELM